MNLCVETAPNVLTTRGEGGPPGSGAWTLAWVAGEGSFPGCCGVLSRLLWPHRRDVKGLAAQGLSFG